MIYNHKKVNGFMDRYFDPKDENKQNIKKINTLHIGKLKKTRTNESRRRQIVINRKLRSYHAGLFTLRVCPVNVPIQ